MNITVHIERLILVGIPVTPRQREALHAAVERELARLLSAGRLSPELLPGGAVPSVRANSIQLADESSPLHLGREIARAVYRGIGDGPNSAGHDRSQRR